jgi:hypothetical protein
MDSLIRSYSSNTTQSTRDYPYPSRAIISSEMMEYSSLISTLQLFLNLEPFFKKMCEASPSPVKLVGKLKVIET